MVARYGRRPLGHLPKANRVLSYIEKVGAAMGGATAIAAAMINIGLGRRDDSRR